MSIEPCWNRQSHQQRRGRLLKRSALTAAMRRFFNASGFTEVETSQLQISPGNETHLHAFATQACNVDGSAQQTLYLHTSPEFACKKLLSAGEEKIFTLARVFRNRESGPLHAREFSMLEWYRAGAPLETLIGDCLKLVQYCAEDIDASSLKYKGMSAGIFVPPQIISITAAFKEYADIDLEPLIDRQGRWQRGELATAAARKNIRVAGDDTPGDIFSRILVEKIEPQLGQGRLSFLTDYPMAEAALARARPEDPRFAERFEMYACGVELANAFGELTDTDEQRLRFEHAMKEKQRIYGERYPIDEEFLDSLKSMPPACGIALGFDRLAMLLTGAAHINDVLWTP